MIFFLGVAAFLKSKSVSSLSILIGKRGDRDPVDRNPGKYYGLANCGSKPAKHFWLGEHRQSFRTEEPCANDS